VKLSILKLGLSHALWAFSLRSKARIYTGSFAVAVKTHRKASPLTGDRCQHSTKKIR